MSSLGDYLIKTIRQKMEDHKRIASGESVRMLREEIKQDHLYIYGVDYWDEINNGVKAGTLVSIADLQNWISNKQSRYGGSFPPASAIQRKIFAKGSSTPKENLQIIDKVLADKREITRLAKKIIFKELNIA
tara:strand:- start:328 stop:723 length:396 start_codon:yes stop_codon:yes gene_type:complete